jgi:hypothetical protein
MIYTIRHSDWQWLIDADHENKRSVLKCKRPADWIECSTFESPEAAAEAVALGKTGQKDWDTLKHDTPFPALASWLMDPAAKLSAVADVLRSAILPIPPKPGIVT